MGRVPAEGEPGGRVYDDGAHVSGEYVHGYSARERTRLVDQAATLTELLHAGTRYPSGSRVLEAGCGVGAQTVIARRAISCLVELQQAAGAIR